MKRPYTEAREKLHRAWSHLKMRRTRGDNVAREVLKACMGCLAVPALHEYLVGTYLPEIRRHQNRKSPLLRLFRKRRVVR